jgi:hypothetical protein
MSNKRHSEMGTAYQLGKILTLEPITGADEEIASSHETNRQSAVKEILLHLFFMSKYGLIDDNLRVAKAEAQYFTATGGHQAAHCAPGQIWYGSKRVQDVVDSDPHLHVEVDNLFGRTDGIDARFNIADSRAEENGLREAFGAACVCVAADAKHARFNRAMQIYPYLSTAFGSYRSQGVHAMRQAIVRQRQLMRRRDPADVAAREVTIAILESYISNLNNADDSIETVPGLMPENVWRDYQSVR